MSLSNLSSCWCFEQTVTFEHADVHSIISSLGHTQHHIQTFFDFALPFLAARQQLLPRKSTPQNHPNPFLIFNYFLYFSSDKKATCIKKTVPNVFGWGSIINKWRVTLRWQKWLQPMVKLLGPEIDLGHQEHNLFLNRTFFHPAFTQSCLGAAGFKRVRSTTEIHTDFLIKT